MTRNHRLIVLVLAFATACSSPHSLVIHDEMPEDAPKGYVEFYCSFCLANVTVLRLEDSNEVHVANIVTRQTIAAALQSPTKPPRLKRIRIAQAPGDHIYVAKLMSPALEGSTRARITVSVRENTLTPVRIDFTAETHATFRWQPVVGRLMPLKPTPHASDALRLALFDSDWGTQWYAIDTLSSMRLPIDSRSIDRLIQLSEADAYEECLQKASALDCTLVRNRAQQAIQVLDGGSRD